MQEKKSLGNLLSNLFLFTAFNNPEFIKGAVSKHLNTSIEDIRVSLTEATEERRKYTLAVYDNEFVLSFDKRVEKPKEIKVPKIVKKPKKWYQISEPGSMVVVETKLSSEKPFDYWVLTAIE